MKNLKTKPFMPHNFSSLKLFAILLTTFALGAPQLLAQQQQRQTGGAGRAVGAGGFGRGTGEYPRSTDVGEAMISVDPETRKIIVIADEDTNLQVQNVIQSLDRPKPQVLIKVVFVQVTLGNDLDLGVEASYTHRINNSTGIVSSAFGLRDAASIAAGGGLYNLIGEDFEATLRALRVKGKTEILSRPSILARNNQQAVIVVGQQVPFITNTRFDAVNGQINTVTYQDIGIILRVTPFISSDGMVEMIVAPEISSVSDRTVNISQGVNAAIIDKRSADTVVVTPNGQTVAIGGLISTQKTEQDRRVPVLGDIPVLGNLFKRKISTHAKTELLIFLTPFVVQHPGDLARMTQDETGRLEDAPKVFTEEETKRFLEGVPLHKNSGTNASAQEYK
jgi:type II secretory pathway component GspD/PulD (secretin)